MKDAGFQRINLKKLKLMGVSCNKCQEAIPAICPSTNGGVKPVLPLLGYLIINFVYYSQYYGHNQ
jgi:hypothetical protein